MNTEEKLIKQLAVIMVIFMLFTLLLPFFMESEETWNHQINDNPSDSMLHESNYLLNNNERMQEEANRTKEIGDCYIRIKKEKQDTMVQVSLQDLYEKKSLQIIFHGLQSEYYKQSSIAWTENGIDFDTVETQQGKVQKGMVSDVHLTYHKKASSSDMQGIFTVTLDKIYVQALYEDDLYIYVGLKEPHEVYDQILVLDAGHGGEDTGSYSEEQRYDEKDLNLQILLKLKELLEKESFKVYYTRLTDDGVPRAARVQLANDLGADFFISLHCNFSTSGSIHGTEAIYCDKENKTNFSSEQLADILLEELVQTIQTRKRSTVKDESILILNRAKVPAVIVEIAYISNWEDLQLLSQEKNQTLIAKGILQGIKQAYEKKSEGKIENDKNSIGNGK